MSDTATFINLEGSLKVEANKVVNLKDRKEFFGVIKSVDESTVKDEILRPIKTTKKDVMKPEDRLKKFMEKMKIPVTLNEAPEKEILEWKMRQIKASALVIIYTYQGETQGETELIERREWFKIPSARGYNKSNLKNIIIINNLPDETNDWINRQIKLDVTSEGYVEIMK